MQAYIVNVPIADLRRVPSLHKKSYEKDPLQESQLIFGEKVSGVREEGDWVFIEALEQKKWSSEHGWKGYPGWVQKKQLLAVHYFPIHNYVVDIPWQPIYTKPEPLASVVMTIPFGSGVRVVDELADFWVLEMPSGTYGFSQKKGMRKKDRQPDRYDICNKGKLFVNAPYLWGGRSAFLDHSEWGITSVDCSGLTNLLYRINGLDIPRDAHDQYLKCQPKKYDDLKAGDLIFSASVAKPERITHVMIHVESEELFESSMAPKCVRRVSTMEKFGTALKGQHSGYRTTEDVIYFGSLF